MLLIILNLLNVLGIMLWTVIVYVSIRVTIYMFDEMVDEFLAVFGKE